MARMLLKGAAVQANELWTEKESMMNRLISISTISAMAMAAAAFAAPGSARAWVVPGSSAEVFDNTTPGCLRISGGVALNDCTTGGSLPINVPAVISAAGSFSMQAKIRGNGTAPTTCIAVTTLDNVSFTVSSGGSRTQNSWTIANLHTSTFPFQAFAANYFHCNLPPKVGTASAAILFGSYT